ncbi:MAG: PHP domain-containing protein [Deltaproteobacteria bacterium]|nr:PHP domain-containing protein [Deltaproteobacteria bacterium]MDX9761734.1 PHP domain-containing protein [Desulfomonilia bacterium]HPW68456.1 PHP domain-containing protein [Deltaproteobacteria bacterium]
MNESGLKIFRCSLHVHTCLSPCGDLDMHPRALVDEALAQGLDIIAVCDHNSSENVPYVMRAARGTALCVIPGMEICTREEAHVLALFGEQAQLSLLQDYIYANLHGLNDEDAFGLQPIVNETGEVEGFNERLLIGAADIPLEDLVGRIHEYSGLAIAAHIDRPSFSVIGQLGFIPPHVPFDALEISARLGIRGGRERFPELSGYPFITSSDAHFIPDIGAACTRMVLKEPCFAEVAMALKRQEGRYIEEGA